MSPASNHPPLPASFPQSDYTPFGYLDNPYHSAVENRSGVIRTVPPMGFGWWARAMPWPYGMDVERPVSYLSFLHLSAVINGEDIESAAFHTSDDFKNRNVSLVSRYHTKNMMSYDWSYEDIQVSAAYFLPHEDSLLCLLTLSNTASAARQITIHTTNIYGYAGHMYWGRDGVTAYHQPDGDLAVSKVWAYGDVMLTGANHKSAAYKATSSVDEWNQWVYQNDLSTNSGALVRFHETEDPIYSIMSYALELPADAADSLVINLTRGVNEVFATRQHADSTKNAHQEFERQLVGDARFYEQAPVLTGDWPTHWKHGWIYDLETLRATIRQPVGIYKHHWDAMQIHSPRAVLGETCLDAFCLSYTDVALAKDVLLGVFADAPTPNVPCSREDGSMNMIGESGAECGTALTWGFPFLVINSVYERDGDAEWIKQLYPYLKAFIDWWLANRTDTDGWFHADNSWESGQDGSIRFLHGDAQEGTPAHTVRTVDIEAGMAHAMHMMTRFAAIAGEDSDIANWQRLAQDRITRTRSMYVDGWFRDWDSNENRPFLLEDYYDVMMLVPLTVGVASPEQVEGVKPKFDIFSKNPTPFLEWPSFWLPFSEAGWNAGLREFIADELFKVGQRIYQRTDAREISPTSARYPDRLPSAYNYRIPGVASEFWPVQLDGHPILNGCEHYGWGATFPSLVIRNLIGFREAGPVLPDGIETDAATRFTLAPALPGALLEQGRAYSITNLGHGAGTFDVTYTIGADSHLTVRLAYSFDKPSTVMVSNQEGNTIVSTTIAGNSGEIEFEAINGAIYEVGWSRTLKISM